MAGKVVTKTKAIKKAAAPPAMTVRKNRATVETRANELGINGDPNLMDGYPRYINAKSDKVTEGNNNTWVVMGRDRPATRASGYGGTGDTHCGAIDIVCGRLAWKAAAAIVDPTLMGPPEPLETDPNFIIDAARIYISQKTDIDKNFNLKKGTVGTSKTKSGIGIKADAIRIIGREGIKLVTRTDEKNSQGADVISTVGVDIIAGNDDKDLQPMVKGTNLELALQRLSHHVSKLNGVVDKFLETQMEFNATVANHWHVSPFFACPTTFSPDCQAQGIKTVKDQLTKVKRSLLANRANIGAWNATYVKQTGKKYINSRWNHVN